MDEVIEAQQKIATINDDFPKINSQQAEDKPSKQRRIPIFTTSLIIFLLLCGGVFAFYLNKINRNEKIVLPSPSPTQPTVKPTPTTNPTITYNLSSLSIMLSSGKTLIADLIVTSPKGLKIGKDPISNKTYNELGDNSSYGVEQLSADDGSGRVTDPQLVFNTGLLESGDYTIEIIGKNTGNYHLIFQVYDRSGKSHQARLSGTIQKNSINKYILYDSNDEISITTPENIFQNNYCKACPLPASPPPGWCKDGIVTSGEGEFNSNNNCFCFGSLICLGSSQKYSTSESICASSPNGKWISDYNECEGITNNTCNLLNGEFNHCASACRHDPKATICALNCVPVCTINN